MKNFGPILLAVVAFSGVSTTVNAQVINNGFLSTGLPQCNPPGTCPWGVSFFGNGGSGPGGPISTTAGGSGQTNLTVVQHSFVDVNPFTSAVTGSGNYSGYANLATGTLGFSTSSQSQVGSATSAGANVDVGFQDGLLVAVANATPKTFTTVAISLMLDGNATGTYNLSDDLVAGGTSGANLFPTAGNPLPQIHVAGVSYQDGQLNTGGQVFSSNAGEQVWTGKATNTAYVTIEGSSALIPLYYEIVAQGGGYSDTLNFSDTAQLSVSLPTGVTATSESGLLLTQSTVPLPTAGWLLFSGLGGLSALARKKRTA